MQNIHKSHKQEISNIDLINKAEEMGLLKPMINCGLMSCKILRDREMYYYIDSQRKSGIKMKDIIYAIEDSFKVKRATVYNVVKMFES